MPNLITSVCLEGRPEKLAEGSCANVCIQTYTMMINSNDSNGRPDPTPGPTDDGYIAVAVKSMPQDPLCCAGQGTTEDGASSKKCTTIAVCSQRCVLPALQRTKDWA